MKFNNTNTSHYTRARD